MQSLVQRQLRSVVPGVFLTLLAVGILVDLLVSNKLEQEFDNLLIAKSSGLIALTEDGNDGFEVEHYEVTLPNYTDIDEPDYFEFVTDAGEIIKASVSLHNDSLFTDGQMGASARFQDIELPDGRAGRVVQTRYLPRADFDAASEDDPDLELDAVLLESPDSPKTESMFSLADKLDIEIVLDDELLNYPYSTETEGTISSAQNLEGIENFKRMPLTLRLASSRENLDALIRSMHLLFLLAGLFTIGMVFYLLRRGTVRAMSPLNELADQVATINESRLDQQLRLNDSVSELNLLTSRFNFLLNHLQEAFSREKRFTGDMAHELHTPVSEIRTLLDVHKRWPEDDELRENFIDDVDAATTRMQRTVANLLSLARSESPVTELESCDDLGRLIEQRIKVVSERAAERNITFAIGLPNTVLSTEGCDQWIHILDNLLCNAVDHGNAHSVVNIDLARNSGPDQHCVFEISNEVIQLDQQDLPVMFERMWQKDAARTSSRHSGLGLTLVLAYAEQIDATVETDLTSGRFSLRVLFPSVL